MFHLSCHCRGLRTSSRLIDLRQQHSQRIPTIANVTVDDVCLNVCGKRWEVLDCAALHLSSLAVLANAASSSGSLEPYV